MVYSLGRLLWAVVFCCSGGQIGFALHWLVFAARKNVLREKTFARWNEQRTVRGGRKNVCKIGIMHFLHMVMKGGNMNTIGCHA